MARTTRASAAIDRLKRRSDNNNYAMVISGNGLISLVEYKPDAATDKLCAPMQLDDFVAFVNAFGPQTPKRVTKLDIAFNKQLTRKPN